MTEPRVVELIGKRITITDTMRADVVAELPEIEWISDSTLRQNVTDAWAAAFAVSPFSRISEMKPSGNYDTRPLRHGTQADHFRSVTRMAVKIAEEMAALFPDFRYDPRPSDRRLPLPRHRQGMGVRPRECPAMERRSARERLALDPPPRLRPLHLLSDGTARGIAHCAAAHSGEGELVQRSLENTILHQADYTFWRVADAGGQLSESDPWLDGELAAQSGARI